jgi:hypothetical protein
VLLVPPRFSRYLLRRRESREVAPVLTVVQVFMDVPWHIRFVNKNVEKIGAGDVLSDESIPGGCYARTGPCEVTRCLTATLSG